ATPHDRAVEAGDNRTGSGRGGDRHAQVPLLARLVYGVEPLDQPLGLTSLGRLFLGRLGAEVAADLVVVAGFAAGVLDALLHPGPLSACPRLERAARVGVLVVGLASMST